MSTKDTTGPSRTPVWEDFVDIFYVPSQVFARRQQGGFAIPLVVLTVLLGILYVASMFVLQPVFDAEWNRQAARMLDSDARMTEDQLSAGRAMAEKLQAVIVFISVPIAVLFMGLLLWIAGKLVEAKQTLAAALMVATYSHFPRIIESLLNAVQGIVLDPASLDGRFRLTFGPARFLDPDVTSPMLLAVVGRLDLITIWVTILLAIGLSVTGRISKRWAAAAAVIVWMISALPGLFGVLRS